MTSVDDLLDLGGDAPVPDVSELNLSASKSNSTEAKRPDSLTNPDSAANQNCEEPVSATLTMEEAASISEMCEAATVDETDAAAAAAAAAASAYSENDVDDLGGSSRMDSGYGSAPIQAVQAGGGDSCKMCQKRVYPMERLTSDGQVYHKSCYRCHKCQRQLSVGNFAIMENQLYCQPHYIELFKLKGSYSAHNGSTAQPVNTIAEDGAAADAAASAQDDAGSSGGHAPKLSNIKSKFESFEDQPPASPSKRKEKVYYAGLQSAKHRYETATSEKERPHSEKPKRFTPPREGSAGVVESEPLQLPPDVVRYYDNGDASDDRPAPGSSRGALARFKEMEQQHQQNGSHPPPAKDAARPRSPTPPGTKPNNKSATTPDFDWTPPVADTAMSESQPTPLPPDVVRSGGPDPDDELPPANAARSALQLWRDKEVSAAAGPPPNPETSERRQRELRQLDRSSLKSRQFSPPTNANSDEERLEADYLAQADEAAAAEAGDELPAAGTARSLRSLFDAYGQHAQQSA